MVSVIFVSLVRPKAPLLNSNWLLFDNWKDDGDEYICIAAESDYATTEWFDSYVSIFIVTAENIVAEFSILLAPSLYNNWQVVSRVL